MNKIKNRVIEIMKSEGMDTTNQKLVLNLCILYLQAQNDYIKQQMQEAK